MGDDIDDLLNEFESKFCGPKSVPTHSKRTPSQAPKASISAPSKAGSKNDKSDIDDILNEILDDEELKKSSKSKSTPTAHKHGSSASLSSTQGSKCFPVYIGGSKYPEGPSTTVNQRACDRLRCTDCDFQVSRFDNYKWHSSTDYLFLRNNMPDYDRVRSKLVSKKGYRAYACQCQSRSVQDMTDVQAEPDLKWVCGKH